MSRHLKTRIQMGLSSIIDHYVSLSPNSTPRARGVRYFVPITLYEALRHALAQFHTSRSRSALFCAYNTLRSLLGRNELRQSRSPLQKAHRCSPNALRPRPSPTLYLPFPEDLVCSLRSESRTHQTSPAPSPRFGAYAYPRSP